MADLLERILDKGIVIAGDIKVKIVDIELLTIQIRLLICSVDKPKKSAWIGGLGIPPSTGVSRNCSLNRMRWPSSRIGWRGWRRRPPQSA